MNDFLAFRKMITPAIIQVIFWFGVAICVILGLALIIHGATENRGSVYGYGGGEGEVSGGLLVLILGPIGVRIWCELMILFFRMNETLTDIRNSVKGSTSYLKNPSDLETAGPQTNQERAGTEIHEGVSVRSPEEIPEVKHVLESSLDITNKIRKLAELMYKGILTQEEFDDLAARLRGLKK